jgi:two-component system, OmpR family, KDP operon response regulator KdpE
MGKGKVLIATDDSTLSRALRMVLTAKGYQVAAVQSDEQALLLSRSGRYELVLLDEDMTDASIIETCEQIRSFSEVPLVVMGAEKCVEAMQAGADSYLRKPFGVSEMFASLGATAGNRAVARS